ncbi:MAG: type II toxin-antitoxin system HicA family toxin [Candidatus Yonathbacteria bacterium]|nr:type II toxin-antitoxin system HicA family toxin [Candidatus Yonathbacteria bacterium]
MSPKPFRFTAKQIIRLIEERGFSLSRQNGSHIIFHNDKGVQITVPKHTSNILHPKIVKNILRDIDA